MGYLKYILRNVTRNKLRSILTVLSMAICLALMTVLYGFATLNDMLVPELAKANRMIVMSKDGFTTTIPVSTLNHVRGLPGVKAVIPLSWYIGLYKDEKMATFAQLGTDAKELMNVWTEFTIDPAQLKAWQENRQGCIIDRRNAERRGWKIGEHIPLKGNNYGFDLDLELCGVYDGPEFINDSNRLRPWSGWYRRSTAATKTRRILRYRKATRRSPRCSRSSPAICSYLCCTSGSPSRLP